MSNTALTLSRMFNAPRERVFEAFTKQEAIETWFGPEGFTIPNCSVDLRPGGKYRIEMHGPDGDVHVVVGQYREVSPPERLSFTWAWLRGDGVGPETLVTLTFAAKDGGTEMTLVHSGFTNEEMRDGHNRGWTSSFEDLRRALAGTRQPTTARPTVLGDPRSSYVRSVRMALVEKGIAYALEPHAPHSEPINAVHPFGRVPAMRNGPLVLFEAGAIMRYVDEAFPGPALCPATAGERAQMEQWISAINCYTYDPMIRRYVLQYIFPKGADGKPDRGVIDTAMAEIRKQLGMFDGVYGSRNHLVGDRLTLADLLLAPILFYVQAMPEGKELLAPHGNVRRAYEAIATRDSFKATMPPMS